jgi:hypothetical protein
MPGMTWPTDKLGGYKHLLISVWSCSSRVSACYVYTACLFRIAAYDVYRRAFVWMLCWTTLLQILRREYCTVTLPRSRDVGSHTVYIGLAADGIHRTKFDFGNTQSVAFHCNTSMLFDIKLYERKFWHHIFPWSVKLPKRTVDGFTCTAGPFSQSINCSKLIVQVLPRVRYSL